MVRALFFREGWAAAEHVATLRRLLEMQIEALVGPHLRGATPTHGYVYQLHHGHRTFFGWSHEWHLSNPWYGGAIIPTA